MANPGGRRRGFRSLLVDPYKQVKLGLIMLVVNLLFAALILAVFGWYIFDIFNAVSGYFKLSGQEEAFVWTKYAWPVGVGFSLVFLFVITTLWVSIRYTHEIYGPLVSIHRFLDEILSGRTPPRLALRQSDQLQDLAEKLNLVAERFGGK
jgi:hypothetical protein